MTALGDDATVDQCYGLVEKLILSDKCVGKGLTPHGYAYGPPRQENHSVSTTLPEVRSPLRRGGSTHRT